MSNQSSKKTLESSGDVPAGDTLYSTPAWIGALNKWNLEFAVLYRKRLQE